MTVILDKIKANRRYIVEWLILVVAIICMAKILKVVRIFPMSCEYESTVITGDDEKLDAPEDRSLDEYDNLLPLKEGDVIKQTFVATMDNMAGVELALVADGNISDRLPDIQGDMDITIIDATTGEMVASEHVLMAGILWIDRHRILFSENAEIVSGNLYELTITVNSVDNRRELYADMISEDRYTAGDLLVNQSIEAKDLVLLGMGASYSFWLSGFAWFVAFFIVVISILYYMLRVRKAKLEYIYLLPALFFGAVYLILLPPYVAPDDQTHINNSYYYSNKLLGVEDTPATDTIYMRYTDAAAGFMDKPSMDVYNNVRQNIFGAAENDEMIEVNYNPSLKAAWYVYIPGIAGITMGRMLGLNGVTTIYLGALFQYMVFVLAVFLCIKYSKNAKLIYMVTAFLPMVLQQATSYSYDVTVMIAAFVFSMLCMNLMQEEGNLTWKYAVILLLCTFLLIKVKMGAYAPLCIAILLVNKKLFKTKKRYMLAIGIYLGICLSIFMASKIGYLKHIAGSDSGKMTVEAVNEEQLSEQESEQPQLIPYENYISWAKAEGYTVGYLLRYPGLIPNIVVSTFHEYSTGYVEGMIGNPIGWSQHSQYYPDLLIYLYLIILICSALAVSDSCGSLSEGSDIIMTKSQKLIALLAVIGVVGCIMAGMLFSWTPRDVNKVLGVQGRYFLPVVPLLLSAARGKTVMSAKPLRNVLIVTCVCLQLWALWSITYYV